MDKFGQGVQFQYSMLQKNKELNFEGFNRQMLLEMCILSGCDYLQSLPGMGLKKAHASIKRFKSYDKVRMVDRVDMHDYSKPKNHVHICTYKHTQTSFRYFIYMKFDVILMPIVMYRFLSTWNTMVFLYLPFMKSRSGRLFLLSNINEFMIQLVKILSIWPIYLRTLVTS